MQISFRLAQILKVRGVSGRGAINEIAEKAKLKRHQVSALMQNRVKHLPLETLGAICEYLVVEHQIPRAQLPAILFALEPEELWSLLGERRYIEICFGVRPDKFRNEMIVASDSYLHGVLLKELFGAKRDERTEAGRDDRGQQNGHTLQQRLVKAFEEHIDTDEAISEAQTVYNDFQVRPGDRGLICLGSIKSNVVIELPIANVFNAKPFVPQDDVDNPRNRSCPFFFQLRRKDPDIPSCYAGRRLSKSKNKYAPGIHYELANGKWTSCPCSETEDAAMVVYVYRPAIGVMETVMGGFSSRATRCLADALLQPIYTAQLWPPTYNEPDLQVGVFIVRFSYDQATESAGADEDAAWRYVKAAKTKIIPLSEAALRRHLSSDE